MQVKIKKFEVNMEVKSNGIEFEVRDPGGNAQIGDCVVTMTGLTWCKGRTSQQKGIKISWGDFTEIMKSKESKRTAVKAAKNM